MGVLCRVFVWYALRYVHSSFAKHLDEEEIWLSFACLVTVNVLWLFLAAVGWSAVFDYGMS